MDVNQQSSSYPSSNISLLLLQCYKEPFQGTKKFPSVNRAELTEFSLLFPESYQITKERSPTAPHPAHMAYMYIPV
jgi:hypothetical protein